MKLINTPLYICLLMLVSVGCDSGKQDENPSFAFKIVNLTDGQYPDNPDLGYMSDNYDYHLLQSGQVKALDSNSYLFEFFADNKKEDLVIKLPNIPMMEFMPSIPHHLRSDTYLSYLAVINQEWNRNQVRLAPGEFESSNDKITRVDLARNCLNSYLWELIIYTDENGKTVPYAHAWFKFPPKLYKKLFKQRNGVDFNRYKDVLLQYKVGKSREIHAEVLRKIEDSIPVAFSDKSDAMYPLKAARLKKRKEIIVPKEFATMRDLQSDETKLATFLPPGRYAKSDPRSTELGRLKNLDKVNVYKTSHAHMDEQTNEIHFAFSDDKGRITNLYFGGLNLDVLPKLSPAMANDGWKISMGFSNHTFYETLPQHEAWSSKMNPYYGYLSDEYNNWLDSHDIGIDGPIMHWDAHTEGLLHVWLLSFERHALVGHYEIQFE